MVSCSSGFMITILKEERTSLLFVPAFSWSGAVSAHYHFTSIDLTIFSADLPPNFDLLQTAEVTSSDVKIGPFWREKVSACSIRCARIDLLPKETVEVPYVHP